MKIPTLFPGTKPEIISEPPSTRVLDHGFVTLRNIAGPTRRPDKEFDADDRDPAQAV